MAMRNLVKALSILFAIVGVVVTCDQVVRAGLIPIPTSNVSSSSEIGGSFTRWDDHLVDGSGLSGGQHTVTPDGNMWLSSGDAFGGADPDPYVMFDLGAVYTIDRIHVWNYNEVAPNYPPRGVNAVSVQYGTTAAMGSTVPGITNFAMASGANTYTGESFDAFPAFNARYVKFDIDSNHGGDNNFYGLSEVQFYGELAPVPEPATAVLFATCLLALTGFCRRRKR